MIAIHPIHRRLAELTLKVKRLGGYNKLTPLEQKEIEHCMNVNAEIVRHTDELKQLSFIAHCAGDFEWEQELCKRLDDIEVKLM